MGRLIVIALLFAGLTSTFAVGDAPWRAQLADEPHAVGEPSIPLDDDRSDDSSDDAEMTEPEAARTRLGVVARPWVADAGYRLAALLIPDGRVLPVPVPPPIA